jgi:hypothetical protein
MDLHEDRLKLRLFSRRFKYNPAETAAAADTLGINCYLDETVISPSVRASCVQPNRVGLLGVKGLAAEVEEDGAVARLL